MNPLPSPLPHNQKKNKTSANLQDAYLPFREADPQPNVSYHEVQDQPKNTRESLIFFFLFHLHESRFGNMITITT